MTCLRLVFARDQLQQALAENRPGAEITSEPCGKGVSHSTSPAESQNAWVFASKIRCQLLGEKQDSHER